MVFVVFIILLSLVFDFYNGMNDAANSIATIVSTRVLTPFQAVAWAAFFNFAAVFIFGVSVANTIGKGIIDISLVDNAVISGGVIGAILMSAIATHNGMPISISHAIIGGYAGAGVAKAGFAGIVASSFGKIVLFMFLAPILGLVIALLFSICNNLGS